MNFSNEQIHQKKVSSPQTSVLRSNAYVPYHSERLLTCAYPPHSNSSICEPQELNFRSVGNPNPQFKNLCIVNLTGRKFSIMMKQTLQDHLRHVSLC